MKQLTFLISVVTVLTILGCNLGDESIPIEGSQDASSLDLLPYAISQSAFNQSALGGRSCAIIMQYLEEQDFSIQNYKNNNLSPEFFENLWTQGYYTGSLATLNALKAKAQDEDNKDLTAIASILLANEFYTLTSMFGDIPFTEALRGDDIPTPRYDTQKSVLEDLIDLLNEALLLMDVSVSVNPSINTWDPLFQGNMLGWRKLANGLKARMLHSMRNQDSSRDDEIMLSINSSFLKESEQAQFQYSMAFPNPQYTFQVDRPGTLKIGEHFISQLTDSQDPRLDQLIMQQGIDYLHFIEDVHIPVWFEPQASIPILSYTELLFIKAETRHHMGADAFVVSDLLGEAITQNFLDIGIEVDDSTLNFIAELSNLSGLDHDAITQHIVEQAYIAYYGNNHLQSWNNFRRTGFPAIISTSSSASDINPSNAVPKRFLYPTSELTYNLANTDQAKSNQGGALLDVNLWMFE